MLHENAAIKNNKMFRFISVKFDFGGKIIANGYETEISELTKQLTNGFAGLQNGWQQDVSAL